MAPGGALLMALGGVLSADAQVLQFKWQAGTRPQAREAQRKQSLRTGGASAHG